jgi:hypothetical protein
LVLHPLDLVPVASEPLGPHADSMGDRGQLIADAFDELINRSWG